MNLKTGKVSLFISRYILLDLQKMLTLSSPIPPINPSVKVGTSWNFESVSSVSDTGQAWSSCLTLFVPNGIFLLIYSRSPFQNLGVSGCIFIKIYGENDWTFSKQWRPWSDAVFCGIWSGPARFARVHVLGFLVLNELKNISFDRAFLGPTIGGALVLNMVWFSVGLCWSCCCIWYMCKYFVWFEV